MQNYDIEPVEIERHALLNGGLKGQGILKPTGEELIGLSGTTLAVSQA